MVTTFINKLLDTLRNEGKEDEVQKKYMHAVNTAKDFCISSFEAFGKFGGQYTSHGFDHSERVLSFALQIAENLENPLRAIELFYLGLSAILHDIGMTAHLPESRPADTIDETHWDKIRKRHGDATAEMLKNVSEYPILENIVLIDKDLYYGYLPHICAAHTTRNFKSNIKQIKQKSKAVRNDYRFDIIAGILLLADELDLIYHRADIKKGHYDNFRTSETKAHWWKHWLIANVKIENNTISICHVSEKKIEWSTEFSAWSIAKIKQQIKLLEETLDTKLWDFYIEIKETDDAHWLDRSKLNYIPEEVVKAAQVERLEIPGQKMKPIFSPGRLIDKVENRESLKDPSVFFKEVIEKKIHHFRGHGQHAGLDNAKMVYVEEQRNTSLLLEVYSEWQEYIEESKQGIERVRAYLFSGSVGVGKTHFLSIFLNKINEFDICKKVIIARSEFTECEKNNLLDLQRCVAYALFNDLENRLGILGDIRAIMEDNFPDGVEPVIPNLKVEIESWDVSRINSFIKVIGEICRSNDGIHKKLAEKAPVALCIFCDNSDQMDIGVNTELCTWGNNISGRSNSLVWLFFRPETIAKLKQDYLHSASSYTFRDPRVIYSAEIEKVIKKRLNTFHSKFQKNEKIKLGNKETPVTDCIEAVKYFADLMLHSSDCGETLINLSKRPDGDGQVNLRATLYMWIHIVGSHIISNEDYKDALRLQLKSKDPFEMWPKAIEALLLGRREWYDPSNSVVENLFDPPNVIQHGDYFIIIHCLQILTGKGNFQEFSFRDICRHLKKLGYERGRIAQILKFLSDRLEINEGMDDAPLDKNIIQAGRLFPLVNCKFKNKAKDISETSLIRITPWGKYHLDKLIYEFKYWKHIHYQIVFPQSEIDNLDIKVVHGELKPLKYQLKKVIDFLEKREKSWLFGISDDELKDVNIYPIMDKISKSERIFLYTY